MRGACIGGALCLGGAIHEPATMSFDVPNRHRVAILRAVIRHRESDPRVMGGLLRADEITGVRLYVVEPGHRRCDTDSRAARDATTHEWFSNRTKRRHRCVEFPECPRIMPGCHRSFCRAPTRLHLDNRRRIAPKRRIAAAASERHDGHHHHE